MDAVLTQFVNHPTAADCLEKAANFCLAPMRFNWGRNVTVLVDADSSIQYQVNSRVPALSGYCLIDRIAQFFIGLFAFTVGLPLTLAGMLFVKCSSSHQDKQAQFVQARLASLREPHPKPRVDQQTLRKDAGVAIKKVAGQALPADFDKTLQEILSKGFLEGPLDDADLLAKIESDNIAGHILRLAATADEQRLPLYATVLFILNRDGMGTFLKVLSHQGVECAATAESPLKMGGRPVFLRDFFLEALEPMRSPSAEATDLSLAGRFFNAAPIDWVNNNFSNQR